MSEERWPFERQDPDCVVLPVRAGHTPSDKPPVRIFLGTEEAQYRAERVFFYSIEKFRDPARVYEIYLMKNIKGFDRRKWRTGFTLYRFAIPSFAGDSGKAIYNDVDQIYLADPALLFDLELGDHGFLAIHAKDTSVMVMDCARMLPMWNREAARTKGKKALTNAPAAKPGLYGKLDGHWNARDDEYVEGLTKCLHYTALHQQPWEPFPGDYSYHPNPLAYIWHELEQEADAQGYHPFSAASPSPEFWSSVGQAGQTMRHSNPAALKDRFDLRSVLYVTVGGGSGDLGGLDVTVHDLQRKEPWPDGGFDAVVLDGLFDVLPPVDFGWLAEAAFRQARRLVWFGVPAFSIDDPQLGSPSWWHQRVLDAARPHDQISWLLDVGGLKQASFQINKFLPDNDLRVWALCEGDDCRASDFVAELGWPHEVKQLSVRSASNLPDFLLAPGLGGLDPVSAASIKAPWPDLVIAAGAEASRVAQWIKRQSGERTRLVQIGQPGAPFSMFDLILALPDERLPIRPNVMHTTSEFIGSEDLLPWVLGGDIQLGDGEPSCYVMVFLGEPVDGYVLPAAKLQNLAAAVRDKAQALGAGVVVVREANAEDGLIEDFKRAFGLECLVLDAGDAATVGRYAYLARHFFTTGDNLARIAQVVLAESEISYIALPKWHETKPLVRPIAKFLGLLTGGGRTYRGTPYQQHVVGRLIDQLATRGVSILGRDHTAYHQALKARGLLQEIDQEAPMARPRPLNDVERAVQRVRAIMSQTVIQRS